MIADLNLIWTSSRRIVGFLRRSYAHLKSAEDATDSVIVEEIFARLKWNFIIFPEF